MHAVARLFAVASLCAMAAVPAKADRPDHLIPETSLLSGGKAFFGERDAYISRAFEDGYSGDVVVRAVILPAFHPEILVGLRTLDGKPTSSGYQVFYLRAPGRGFFKYEDDADFQRRGPPKPPDQIAVLRCEKPIGTDLANRIIASWQASLLQTRYDAAGDLGTDGVTFRFYAMGQYQELSGWTWTPAEGTTPYLLADVADTLVAFCDGKATAGDLSAKTDALQAKLKR